MAKTILSRKNKVGYGIYIQNMYYSAFKKKDILPSVTTWINMEYIMLSEIRQSLKDGCTLSHLYVESQEV